MKKILMAALVSLSVCATATANAETPPDFKISGIVNVIEQGNTNAKLTFTSKEDGLVLKDIRASSPSCLVQIESDDVVPTLPITLNKGQSLYIKFVDCPSLKYADAINVAGNVTWTFAGK